MELDIKITRLNNMLRSYIPASITEDVLRKVAFTYYLYVKKFGDYPNCDLDRAATKLKKHISITDCNLIFSKEEELKDAIYSCVNDISFFAIDNERKFDYMELEVMLSNFNQDELRELLNYKFEHTLRDESTPDCVSDLVLAVADMFGSKHEKVTDMACAKGDFLLKASKAFKKVEGVEINSDASLIAKMRLYVNEISGEIRRANCFEDSWHHQASHPNRLSDLVFAEFPWKLVIKDPKEREIMYNCNANRFYLSDNNTTDFFFLSAMMNYLREDGIAIGIVPLSSLSNLNDRSARENIVKRGFLRAVITLPGNLFSKTSIATAMVVLGERKEGNILFFDGSNFCHQENRKWNVINVTELVSALKKELETGETCLRTEILAEHDYSFSPSHYLSDVKRMIPNAGELESVADIFTGWQCPSAKLESIHKTDGTGIRLLQMSNVENGCIVNKLERYDIPENTLEKFKVQGGDVVISTKSLKVKSAVVDLDTSDPIIASGSIMVIRPKLEKLDPYFLVAYFESDLGKATLKMYQTGSIIPNLSIGNVKKIPLPCLDYKDQVRIGNNYRELRDLITSEKRRLQNLQDKANKMLDDLWDKEEGK